MKKIWIKPRETLVKMEKSLYDISPDWDQVVKLCDFSSQNANKNSTKDTTRMKSILLQLQQQTTKNAS